MPGEKPKWSGPSLKDLGVRVLRDGRVKIRQHFYVGPGEAVKGEAEFATVNEAQRSLVHAQQQELRTMAETRSFYAELRDIHTGLESLGKGATPKQRQPFLERLQSVLNRLELKERPLKVEAGKQLVDHFDAREKQRIGALELLEASNWPAAQACMAKMLRLLKAENKLVYREVLPVLRLREQALRAYKSNHLFYLNLALERVRMASKGLEAEAGMPLFASRWKPRLSNTANLLKGLDYLHSDKAWLHLSNTAKHAGLQDFVQARRGLRQAENYLKQTISRLHETKTEKDKPRKN